MTGVGIGAGRSATGEGGGGGASGREGAGPLRLVLAQVAAGVPTVSEIGRRTGLTADVVAAAIEQLVRMGALDAKEVSAGCPSSGCGGCASGVTDGGSVVPGCGAPGPSASRQGPVLVALSVPPASVAGSRAGPAR